MITQVDYIEKIERLRKRCNDYLRHSERMANSKRYEVSLRAEGRSEAYRTIKRHVEKIY